MSDVLAVNALTLQNEAMLYKNPKAEVKIFANGRQAEIHIPFNELGPGLMMTTRRIS